MQSVRRLGSHRHCTSSCNAEEVCVSRGFRDLSFYRAIGLRIASNTMYQIFNTKKNQKYLRVVTPLLTILSTFHDVIGEPGEF